MSHSNPTQAQVILDHLLAGKPLTALDALNEYGCFRLAARVFELRQQGYDIEEVMVSTKGGKRHAQYFIRTFELQYA